MASVEMLHTSVCCFRKQNKQIKEKKKTHTKLGFGRGEKNKKIQTPHTSSVLEEKIQSGGVCYWSSR